MALLNLPPEILATLASFLGPIEGVALLCTSQTCRLAFEPILYWHDANSSNPAALLWAAGEGEVSTAEKALAASRGDCAPQGIGGPRPPSVAERALYRASAEGYDSIVQLLLNKNVAVDAQGGELGTALHAASDRGHEKVVQLLLGTGARG
ncbi:hypothetical protein DER44DRAFT_124755 [Fusarium oxysporum]|nr:hypothetical protein DER44DRAFT_124755 [Fusarium oxysporum]